MGKLIADNGRFVFEGSFAERLIPKGAGFRWDPAGRQWWTDDARKAARLFEHAEGAAREQLAELAQAREATLTASRATDAVIDVPAPEGLEYLPFQRAGIAFAARRTNVLIGDEMGLGKTIQALGAINADASIARVLVICPNSLKLNWAREAAKWLVRPVRCSIVTGKAWEEAPAPAGGIGVTIINYDVLAKHPAALRAQEWDVLIVDEAHYLKNPKAARTQAVLGGRKKVNGAWTDSPAPIPAKRRIVLTGTPILNRPIELWPLAHALAPETFRSWRQFAFRYCGAFEGRYGLDVSGASNLPELQELLRESILIRRLKKDVLTELPAKRRQVIELAPNGAGKLIAAERLAIQAREAALEALQVAVELAKAGDDEIAYEAAVKALRDCGRIAFEEISKARHELALAKVPHVVEHLQNLLESVEQVVVFAHHRDVVAQLIAALTEAGISTVKVTGETPIEERQAAVDAFQAGTVRVFVGNIQAAGVGLTLTRASHVVFAELDWVPANLSQAEDRCHRIGQVNSVLVQHLVFDESLDARIAKRVVAKQAIADKALDEVTVKQPILPTVEAPSTRDVRREELAKVAAELTDAQVVAIHLGLQTLAAFCDGARQLDGAGFNKLDTRLGKDLAAFPKLTKKQAALGQRLVRKYHGQLPEELVAAAGAQKQAK